jgi:hypothetical protein
MSEKTFYQPRGMNGIYEWNKVAIEHLFEQAYYYASIERERLTFLIEFSYIKKT